MICGISGNFLQKNAYQLLLPRFPLTQFFSTDFTMPQLSLPVAQTGTPFVNLRLAGDKPDYTPFTFNFMVNEDMTNYEEIFNWIHSIGFDDRHSSYTNYNNKDHHTQRLGEQDAKVIIMSAQGNPLRVITFHDSIPIALSGYEQTTQIDGTEYIRASVTMAYTRYSFNGHKTKDLPL